VEDVPVRRRGIEWTPGRKWAAAAMVSMLVCGLLLLTGRVGISLIFLALAAVFVIVGATADKRWRG
jgi:hypothetical protein